MAWQKLEPHKKNHSPRLGPEKTFAAFEEIFSLWLLKYLLDFQKFDFALGIFLAPSSLTNKLHVDVNNE